MYINVNYPEVSWNGGHPKLDKFSIETHGFADSAFQAPPCKSILPRCLDIFLLGVRMYNSCMIWTRMRCVCVSLLCTLWYHVSVAGANRYSTIRSNHVPTTPLDPPWILTNILAKQSPLFVSLDIHAGKITHVNIALLSSIEACNKLYDLFIIYIPIYIYTISYNHIYIYTISCNHIYIYMLCIYHI